VVVTSLQNSGADEAQLLSVKVEPFRLRHPLRLEAAMQVLLDLPCIVDPDNVNGSGLDAQLKLTLTTPPVVSDADLVEARVLVLDHVED